MFRHLFIALAFLSGCGRYFPGPLTPNADQASQVSVSDDGSVTFELRRLKIALRPMTDEQLNRQFQAVSERGAASTNPYTFGNWQPLGDDFTPARFTVFLVTVSNYEFPKVRIDPGLISITTSNNRTYYALTYGQLSEYFRAYWQGRTGEGRTQFRERTDLLRRTLLADTPIFSGQETSGYAVFPALAADVKEIEVHLRDVEVRYDYTGKPVETLRLTYRFHRDVYRGYQPPKELVTQ